jgi:hypothetical protein
MLPTCSCCSDRLIRHIRQGSIYWWCHSCWAEMPNFEEIYARSELASLPEPQHELLKMTPTPLTQAKRPIVSLNRPFAHRVA